LKIEKVISSKRSPLERRQPNVSEEQGWQACLRSLSLLPYKQWSQNFLKMRQNDRFTRAAICVFVWAVLFSAQVAFAAEEVTIVGLVTEQGIVTYDGQVYAVVENNMGKEVMRLLNRKVEVIGIIVERGDGRKSIEISKYGISE